MRKTEYFVGIEGQGGPQFAVEDAKKKRNEFLNNNKDIDIIDERIQLLQKDNGFWIAIITLAYWELNEK